jgi:hypothetical protein
MHKHTFITARRFFAAIASAALCVVLRTGATAGARDMVVWYKQPA